MVLLLFFWTAEQLHYFNYYMLRCISIAKLLLIFEISVKPSEPMLSLKFYQGSCLSCLNGSYATDKPSRKWKQWMETQMTSEAKQSKKPNINRISKKYNVHRSPLQDRISGCVTHGTKPKPWPYLTAEEEKSLTTHLIDVAKLGYGKTRKKVNRMAENVAREKETPCKEKYPMVGGEDLLSDSHNFSYIRNIPQLMSVWMPSVRNLFHDILIYWSLH